MVKKSGLYRDKRKKKQWIVRWYADPDETGVIKRHATGFKLKVDAEKFMAAKSFEFAQPTVCLGKPEEIILQEFCQDFIRTKKAEVVPGTIELYEDTIRRLIDYFGKNMVLSGVTPRNAAIFIAELKRHKTLYCRAKTPLSAWTKHRILRNCKTLFGTAVEWELLGKNPFAKVKSPQLILKPWHFVKPAEYHRLLEVAPTLQWKAFYTVAFFTGARFGELVNLCWSDIDFEIGEVSIRNRTVGTATMPPFLIKDKEERVIGIEKHTIDTLVKLQNTASEGVPYIFMTNRQYQTLVAKWNRFRQQNRPWKNQYMVNNVGREFKRHCKKAGIKAAEGETLSLHSLRKAFGKNSSLLNTDPALTQKLMGHASVSTTLKFYDKVTDDDRKRAAMALGALVMKKEV